MNFDTLYPDAEYGFQPNTPDFCVVKLENAVPCWHCETPTRWCELNFEAHLCSEECVDSKWQEYFDAR